MITHLIGAGAATISLFAVAITTQGDTGIHAEVEPTGYALTVDVQGASPHQGQISISLFDSADTFLETPRQLETLVVNGDGQVTFTFPDLEEGRYAAIATYDRDGNGELNTGLFGIPTEPVGYSNNVRRMGPPRWQDTNFILRADTNITIHLSRVNRQGDDS